MPPNAAATESWKKRSGSASLATRVCVWTSTMPGSTRSPVASTTSRASDPRSGPMATIRPPSMATSARREPSAATTVPPRTMRSVTGDGRSRAAARTRQTSTISISWAPSQRQRRPTSRSRSCQPSSGTMRGEVVGGQLADLRRRRAGAVGEEDLALADAARVERELARRGVRGVVLVVDAGTVVAERDPRRFAAPAAVDEPGAERQQRADGLDRAWRIGLPAGAKVEVADADPHVARHLAHRRRIPWPSLARPSRRTSSTSAQAGRRRASRSD